MIRKKLILGVAIMAICGLCCFGLTACADTKQPTESATIPPETSASDELTSAPMTEAEQQEKALALLQAQRGEIGEVVFVKMGSGVPYAANNVITEYAGETYAFYNVISIIPGYLSDELNARLNELDHQNFTMRDEYDFGVVDGWLVFPENENVPRWCVDTDQETVFDVRLRPNPEQDRIDFLLIRDEKIASEYHALLKEIRQCLFDYADAKQAEDDLRIFTLDRVMGDVEFYLDFWSDVDQPTSLTGMVITPTYVNELGVTIGGYYSLTLPESWSDSVEYEVIPGEAYTYNVSFYHKPDRTAGMGGHLFTLSLIPEWEDYSYLPSYERLGYLEVYRITGGDLVAVYPTDVQFDTGTAMDYQARAAEIDEVLASLTFSAEAAFTE